MTMKNCESFDEEDIHFGRFYKASTQTCKRAMKEIFLVVFYRVYVRPLEAWPTNLNQYCTQVLGWSSRKLRESFSANERAKFDEAVTSADYDLSLLTKMFNKFYEHIPFPESLGRAMRDIKNVRNRVCHEQFTFDETDLRENMEDLQQMLRTLFDETSSFFETDLGNLKKFYLDEVDEIRSAPITGQGMTYFENMEKFREDLVGKFITYGRKELTSFYGKLKILNPFTWLSDEKFPELVVDKIFTPLYIREQERAIDVARLFVTELYSEERQTELGVLPAVLILSGIAGCGKTSLCRYILHVWRTRNGVIQDLRAVDIMIFVEARSITESSLTAYLQKTLLRETCSYFDEKEIVLTLQKINVLFVIDGMDEVTENGKILVEEIFSTLGNARVIITSRPEFVYIITQNMQKFHHRFLKLRIQGFTKEGIKSFTSKILKSCEPNEEKCRQIETEFRSFLRTTGSALGEHLKLPLTAALLIMLWKDDNSRISNITSPTSLYCELFRLCTMKLIARLQASTAAHHIELEGVVNAWLMALAEEAYEMLSSGRFTIESSKQYHLTSLCKKYNIDCIQTLSAFLICEVHERLGGTEYTFSFLHKSQMEYLASLHITKKLIEVHKPESKSFPRMLKKFMKIFQKEEEEEDEDYLLTTLRDRRWWNTVLFTLGHVSETKKVSERLIGDLVDILIDHSIHDNSLMWRIIQESGCHPLVCDLVSAVIVKDFVWKADCESLCNPMNPNVLLMQKTKYSPSGVLLRIVDKIGHGKVAPDGENFGERNNVNLFPILRCLSERPQTNVVLRLDQHYYEWGNMEFSDDIVTTLLPGGKLTAFMGHLGQEGAKAFAAVEKLGETCIRVTDLSTLQTLENALASGPKKRSVDMLTVRVDIPWTATTEAIPKINTPSYMSLILKDVSDVTEERAADVIIKMRNSYEMVDLVASSLSPAGGLRFLKRLIENKIEVFDKITIRSCYGIDHVDYEKLNKDIQYNVEWLW
ncbi:uncharacterized protein LOC134787919 [Penaeus indicus]|uniref:uncharacterized protein LOC134787919 n=1 Tax=Penaeus indicus TaxID=29960 RepID=UPI00300C0DD7